MADFLMVEHLLIPEEVRKEVLAAGPRCFPADVNLKAFYQVLLDEAKPESRKLDVRGQDYWRLHLKELVKRYMATTEDYLSSKRCSQAAASLGLEVARRNDGNVVVWNRRQLELLEKVIA